MSAPPATVPGRSSRLPTGLRPRPQSDRDPAGRDLRAIETAVLVLIGLLLAVAVVYDVGHQVSLNSRESADRQTWRHFAHANIKRLDVRPLERGTTDFVCRSTTTLASAQAAQVRLCLMISGPTVAGLRTVDGGYDISANRPDRYAYRYACFGTPKATGMCGAGGPSPLLKPPR